MTTEIVLDDLSAAETLLIQTANNTYTFSLIDPIRRTGLLMGGVLGDCGVRAALIGLLARRGEEELEDTSKVATGSRAIFLVLSSKGMKRLTTTPITRILRTRTARTLDRIRGLTPIESVLANAGLVEH